MRAIIATLMFVTIHGLKMSPTTPKKSIVDYKWLLEAEKKHGRVAMIAVPTLARIAMTTGTDPVTWLNHQPIESQLIFYSVSGILETFNLRRFGKGFTLKEDETPGKLFKGATTPSLGLEFVENNAGRIAMLAAFAILVKTVGSA